MSQRFTKMFMSLLAMLGLAMVAAPAQAVNTTWIFKGSCIDCGTTPVPVTGTLTVANYTAGAALSTANFVSFSYSSPLVSNFNVTSVVSFYGSLNTGASSMGLFTFAGGLPKLFSTNSTGVWSLIDPVPNDIGTGGTWALASVPEVATWAMMLVGFGGLGAMTRRRRTALAI
jgi:hypothetical protein